MLDGLVEASFFGMPLRDMDAAGWGPPTPRERVLRYIAEHPGCSGQEIREALGFTHLSQVSRLLGALAEDGLVARRAPRGRATSGSSPGRRAVPETPKGTATDHEG